MQYRHEWKIPITAADLLTLRQRLRAVASWDCHAVDGYYQIRSLYFDTPTDQALREKLDGVNHREKFRIRYYDGDLRTLHLEKKSKDGGLSNKQSESLTAEQVQAMVDGDTVWMAAGLPLIRELYSKMQTQSLRPKAIVEYTREPFVFAPGNVRVTFDYHLRTTLHCGHFLERDCVTIPVPNTPILMEVKWDAFLPDIIRDAIQLPGRRACAFSKYAQCRLYI